MTNEKAIEELSVLYERYSKASENRKHTASTGNYGMIDGQYVEAIDLAIKALEQTSYKSDARRWKRRYLDLKQRVIKLEEQQPCEDCISRQELLEELGEEPFNWNDSPEAIQEVRDYQWFRSLVENAQPVTPKTKPCEDCVSRAELLRLLDLETQDTNPSHFNLEDKEDYRKWMLNNGYNTALVQARIYVENLPSAQPQIEPCEDAISRLEVRDLLATWLTDNLTEETWEALETIDGKIEDMQSVIPKSETITDFADRCRECGAIYGKLLKSKTGQWLHPYKSNVACECSVCHRQMPITNDFKFCPNCGCRMIEPQESECDD